MTCGFDSLPNISSTKHNIHGQVLNLLVVGSTGLGKTTLINSLFDIDYDDGSGENNFEDVDLRSKTYKPENNAIEMKLNIIETKGFNNQLNTSESYKPILDYIEARYEDYFREEVGEENPEKGVKEDHRVHCCVYMISPTAERLKPIDLSTMKMLHHRVCLVPVIARSDQYTVEERQAMKKAITKEIADHGIKVFCPREYEMPLAIAASDSISMTNGKRQRCRSFPWGTMYIDENSEFPALRNLLVQGDMGSLIETTHYGHYRKWRQETLDKEEEMDRHRVKFEEKRSFLEECIERKLKESSLRGYM